MALSYKAAVGMAWRKAGAGSRERPGEIFPYVTQKDYDELKSDYTKQYGYTIRIPQFEDVVHLKPNAMKTEAEIKQEKMQNLIRVLESPVGIAGQNYSTIMTWIDNIQDTQSVLIPLASLAWKAAPKVFGKLLPILGWVSLGYDLLNFVMSYGRAPFSPMKGKRAACKFQKSWPFSKWAQWQRIEKIKNWRPNISDFLQAAQVSDQFLGVGLSLGGIMGTIMALPYGAYHYLKGDPVHFAFDTPKVENIHNIGAKGLRNAALISAQGQVFDELTHFYAYITAALGTLVCAGPFRESNLAEMVDDPMNVAIPADRPTDPLTIAVIQEKGLSVEDGVGWPYNGKKEIGMGELIDATHEPIRSHFYDYVKRHEHDWYGWLAAWAMDYVAPRAIGAIDPDAQQTVDDTPEMKVFWKMIKAPLLTDQKATEEQQTHFYEWIIAYKDAYGKEPGILEIEQKLNMMGIKTKNQYPATLAPEDANLWDLGLIQAEE